MNRSLIFILTMILLLTGGASAGTIHVGKDGKGSAIELTAAIQEATKGDTILVYPGVYEHAFVHVFKKDMVIKSVTGPEETILDGMLSPNLLAWLMHVTDKFVFEGFTLRNSRDAKFGGGIRIGKDATPIIRNNIFENNGALWGGGIYISPKAKPLIENNLFVGNVASGAGGAIHAQHTDQNLVIRNNTFIQNNSDQPGSAISLHNASPTIENNLFVGNLGLAAIHMMTKGSIPVLKCNVFWNNSGGDITAVDEADVPVDPSFRTGDPLFADEKTYRLSSGSPFRKGECGVVGW